MHMMRTGTEFDEETTTHFTGLSEKLGSVRVGSCDWKELDGKMSGSDCVRRLYEFTDEQKSNRGIFLENTIRLRGRRCRQLCRKVCNSASRGGPRKTCKDNCVYIAFPGERLSRVEGFKRCKQNCDNAPSGEPRRICKRTCKLIIY